MRSNRTHGLKGDGEPNRTAAPAPLAQMEINPDGLTVTYEPEGSAGLGKLEVSASVPPFAGTACGYFNDDDLRAFTAGISAYPLPDGARPQLSAGLEDQETVGLGVYQVTSRAIHVSAPR